MLVVGVFLDVNGRVVVCVLVDVEEELVIRDVDVVLDVVVGIVVDVVENVVVWVFVEVEDEIVIGAVVAAGLDEGFAVVLDVVFIGVVVEIEEEAVIGVVVEVLVVDVVDVVEGC